MNKINNPKGFTLIELLVVIAIIAILAAILFPVFAKVREKARQTTCLSNEKQLGLAVMQYVQDSDEDYPQCGYWIGNIYPYSKSLGLYVCPDDPSYYGTSTTTISYGYNPNFSTLGHAMGGDHYNPPSNDVIAQAVAVAPASTVMFDEISGSAVGTSDILHNTVNYSQYDNGVISQYMGPYDTGVMRGVFTDPGYSGVPPPEVDALFPTGRHSDGSNFLLADGHVKYLHGSSVSAGFSADSSTTASPGSTGQEADGTGALESGSAATFSLQ